MPSRGTVPFSWTAVFCFILLLLGAPVLTAQDGVGEDRAEIERLRQELARLRSSTAKRIESLEAAIERLERRASEQDTGTAERRVVPTASPHAMGREMNPAVSVIGDFIVDWTEEEDRHGDVELSELEIGFQSTLDPYLRFDVFVALESHGEEELIVPLPGAAHEADEHGDEEGFTADLEEAFVTTLSLPASLQLRAGRMRQKIGRHNQSHTPEDPWADQPTVNLAFFGDHQLIDEGFELSWLTPAPFYWELTGAISRGPGESPTWARADDDDFLTLARQELFWDLRSDLGLQLGQSWARGPADAEGREKAEVFGLDATLRWTPSEYRGLTWQTEVFTRRLPLSQENDHEEDEHEEDEHGVEAASERIPTMEDWGAYTWLEMRFAKRWFAGVRLDYFDYDGEHLEGSPDDRWDASLVLAFWPSEYQTLRFQYKRTWDDLVASSSDAFFVNWVWVIGSHGAHAF